MVVRRGARVLLLFGSASLPRISGRRPRACSVRILVLLRFSHNRIPYIVTRFEDFRSSLCVLSTAGSRKRR